MVANEYAIVATVNDVVIKYGTPILFNLQNDGDIGIGTSTPSTRFHIIDNPSPMMRLENSAAALAQNQLVGVIVFYNPDSGSPSIGPYIYSNASEATGEGGYMSFGTGDGSIILERMRITEDGKVGIGTTVPTHNLTVFGSLNVSNNTYTGKIFAYDYSNVTLNDTHINVTDVEVNQNVNWTPQNLSLLEINIGPIRYYYNGSGIIQELI